MHRDADAEQVLDLLRLRSIYHLKEADPVAWLVPRLDDTTKAALVELQYDEYGTGNPHLLHAGLFARGLEACGLSPAYGAYIDDAPVEILEQNNAMTLFGLNRRLRGAALGHLAAFEATSSLPSRRIAQGLRRVGLPDEIAAYYDEHVEADAVHEQLAVRTILRVAARRGADPGRRRVPGCVQLSRPRGPGRPPHARGVGGMTASTTPTTPTSSSVRAVRCCCGASTWCRTSRGSRTGPRVR